MIELNKIYNENCLETMAKMEDNLIDLTVTSPPYDDLRDYKGYSFEFEKVAKELYRVTKNGGVVVWVVNDSTKNGSETLTSFKQAIYFKEICGFNIHDTMIYEKNHVVPNPPNNKRYIQIFEYMFVLSKCMPTTYNPLLETKKTKCFKHTYGFRQTDGSIKKKEITNNNDMKKKSNVWKYKIGYGISSKDDIAFKHPAIFPEELAKDHILSWSNENDIIYDCFAGSGTTLKVAKLLKRNFIGSEISGEYCNIIEKRLFEQSQLF